MTNAELANALNKELGLSGDAALTVNVIRQWVRWGVLDKSEAVGRQIGLSPEWRRNERTLRRARRLTELRRAGVRRESAYVAHAYIEFGNRDLNIARPAIKAEFSHARAQLMRRVTSDTSFISFAALSATRKKALRHQAGELHEPWADSQFELSPEFYATALDAMRSGRVNTKRLSSLIGSSSESIIPSFDEVISGEMNSVLAGGLPGLFGSPDEIQDSAEQAIEEATARDYRIARLETRRRIRAVKVGSGIVDRPEIPADARQLLHEMIAAGPQIQSGNWLISCFVACLNFQWRAALKTEEEQG